MTRDDADHCRNLYIDLLKRILTNTIYGDPNISPGAATSEYSEELRQTGRDWPAVAHTMIGLKRLDNLQECVERVIADSIPGDLIETGVWRGGAAIFMRGLLKAHGDLERTVWVADSFEGLPRPDPESYPADADDAHYAYSELAISLEEVKDNFRRYDLLDEQVRFVKGWFRDTLPTLSAEQFALIRLDGDMYESTIVALQALYPRLAAGGFVVVDDYGAIEGCRRAIEDYRDANGIFEPMLEADWTGVYWRKGVSSSAVWKSEGQEDCGTIDAVDFFDARTSKTTTSHVVIPRGLSASVRGWAADVGLDSLANRILLRVDDLPPTRAVYGLGRPDVAGALSNPAFAGSGFSGTISTGDLSPGKHTVRVIAIGSNGARLPLAIEQLEFVVADGLEGYIRAATGARHGDVVIDQVHIDEVTREVSVSGWAVDRNRSVSASHVFAVVGSRVFTAIAGLQRPDVALALESDACSHCGYEVRIPAAAIALDDGPVTIRAFTAEGHCFEASRSLNSREVPAAQ